MSGSPVIDAVLELADHFEALGVPLLVGGSLASITWGEPRFTQDVDVVAHLAIEHADALVARLEGG